MFNKKKIDDLSNRVSGVEHHKILQEIANGGVAEDILVLKAFVQDIKGQIKAQAAINSGVEEEIVLLKTFIENLTKQNEELAERVKTLETFMGSYVDTRLRKESEEPYLEVVSESFDTETGIELKLDWNPAMINFLKRNGYHGQDDDDIIEKYLISLFKSAQDNKKLV